MKEQSKKIHVLLLLFMFLNIGYSQVYKNPNGAAEHVTTNYRKLVIPDSLKSFFSKADNLFLELIDFTNTHYDEAHSYSNSFNSFKFSYNQIYTDPNNINPHYFEYMSAFIKKDNSDFLEKINASFGIRFSSEENSCQTYRTNFGKNGIVGYYYPFATVPLDSYMLYDDKIKSKYDNQRLQMYANNLSKEIDHRNGYESALNLAIIYAFGWTAYKGEYGKIIINYQQSLDYLSQMEKQKYFNTMPGCCLFLFKILKAYNLLQLGTMQKDSEKLKQASDIYIDLWNTALEPNKWSMIFTQLVRHIHYNTDAITSCDELEEQPTKATTFYFCKHWNPTYVKSVKLDLSFQIIKCCAEIDKLNPKSILSNSLTPANYGAQVFRQYIENY